MKPHDEKTPDQDIPAPQTETDRKAGIDSEVGDLDDPDAEEDGDALPGRAGGGLAGG